MIGGLIACWICCCTAASVTARSTPEVQHHWSTSFRVRSAYSMKALGSGGEKDTVEKVVPLYSLPPDVSVPEQRQAAVTTTFVRLPSVGLTQRASMDQVIMGYSGWGCCLLASARIFSESTTPALATWMPPLLIAMSMSCRSALASSLVSSMVMFWFGD